MPNQFVPLRNRVGLRPRPGAAFPPEYIGNSSMRMHDVLSWYMQSYAAHTRDLSLLALAPASLLNVGLLVSLTLSLVLSTGIVCGLSSATHELASVVPTKLA